MMTYACANPPLCGVRKHYASTVNPACQQSIGSYPSFEVVTPPRASAATSMDIFPDGSVERRMPVQGAMGKGIATVTHGRDTTSASVVISLDVRREVRANVMPVGTSAGNLAGEYLVAMPTATPGSTRQFRARAQRSPVNAEALVERIGALLDESNWLVEDSGVAQGALGGIDRGHSVEPSVGAATDALRAVRFDVVLDLMRQARRAQVEAGWTARTDDAAWERYRSIGEQLDEVVSRYGDMLCD